MCGCGNNCGCGGMTIFAGQDGRGIVSITVNGNGTLTILYTDGLTQTTASLTGPQGPIGNDGLTAIWKFDTNTGTGPADTYLRYNAGTADICTKIYINYNDVNNTSKAAFLDSFYNNTDTTFGAIYKYGAIRIFNIDNILQYASFEITGLTDQTTYLELDVLFQMRNSNFILDTEVGVTFTPAEDVLRTKVLSIQGWNMDANQFFSINHEVEDYTKIVSVDVMITPDAGEDIVIPLGTWNTSSGVLNGGVIQIDVDDILLGRLGGGIFDAVEYDGGGFRGYVTIKYLK
jgi:hypothetical protein